MSEELKAMKQRLVVVESELATLRAEKFILLAKIDVAENEPKPVKFKDDNGTAYC